jgi:anti-anti-sigma factor
MMDIFRVSSHDVPGGRVITLSGELDASTCRGLLEQLQGPPGSKVIVDLSELTFLDSSGLGTIHVARRLARKDGGTLVVCRPQPAVHRVLQLTGLDAWIAEWDPEWSDRPGGKVSSQSAITGAASGEG